MSKNTEKKIYIVGRNFKNQTGGPANIIRGLTAALKQKNVNVQEICLNESVGKRALIKRLLKIFFKERNCIVNVHTDGLLIPYLVYIFSLFDKKNKYYLTVHGLYFIEAKMNGTYKKRYARIEKKLCKKFPHIICVSELLKQKIISEFERKKDITVVPNGVDTADICTNTSTKFSSSQTEIIMLGGIRERKGVFESIDVLSYLNNNGVNAVLNVYGVVENEEISKKFDERIKELDLCNSVSYKGNLSNKEEVFKVISDADIHLCLSKWDTFNVAIIESLAIGTPCIASDMCGAAYEIKENVNGLVLDLADSRNLDKIKDYILNLKNKYAVEADEIKNLAQSVREKYCWENIAGLYLSAIDY